MKYNTFFSPKVKNLIQ